MRSLVWFREDLRIHDNPALFEAAEASFDGIVALYIIDKSLWLKHHTAACRVEFILRGLAQLSEALSKLAIPLLIREVNDTSDVPKTMADAMECVKAEALFFNRQYQWDELERDKAVQDFLELNGLKCKAFHDQTILPPIPKHKKSFAVFRQVWIKQFIQQSGVKFALPVYEQRDLGIASDPVPSELAEFKSTIPAKLWLAGEEAALKHLEHFIKKGLPIYNEKRDYPAAEGTSLLSVYLSSGMLSVKRCFQAALEANDGSLGVVTLNPSSPISPSGPTIWMNELIWRDFYRHVVYTVPRVAMNQSYRPKMDKVVWDFNQELFDAWKEGRTGFPIVDAAMRQLSATGWMHSRLRVITATFFCKYMYFDWRLGEQYFMNHLIDGDFASNNAGWQGCASAGVDTPAYFRFFDPIRQGERCDPEGEFIKKYCPELTQLDSYAVHFPYERGAKQMAKNSIIYPEPMLELKESRAKATENVRSDIKKKVES